jgi:6-pyruvoyl-tetrahydropterin synthase
LAPRHSITVVHTAEVAHRLYLTPGKCQRIHGHGLTIKLTLEGEPDSTGLLAGIDFSSLKAGFRGFIDSYLDHQVLLNEKDPFAGYMQPKGTSQWLQLPGLRVCAADPTTENLAMWIGQWAQITLAVPKVYNVGVHVDETSVNGGDFRDGMSMLTKGSLTEVLGRYEK